MAESARFDERERRALETDGYVVRRDVFDARELREIRDACEALMERILAERRRTKHPAGAYVFELSRSLGTMVKWEKHDPELVHGIEPFAHLSDALHAWAHDPRLIEPCMDIVGSEDLRLFTEKLNLKRARRGGPVVLHQDYPYWVGVAGDAARVATAMLFLDDATVEKGCLEVAPGSHREGEQRRRAVEDFGKFEMDPEKFELSRLVPLEVPAGSVAFFGAFLVHRSLPPLSGDDRRALLYSYQPVGHPSMYEQQLREQQERQRGRQDGKA
jgi:ectoine hydroxylase-related dioxygenase (phytanoyl-CoA dioxygenase family)